MRLFGLEELEQRLLLSVTSPTASIAISFESPVLSAGATSPINKFGWTPITSSGVAAPYVWQPSSTSTDFSAVDPLASPAQGNQCVTIPQAGAACQLFVGTISANTRYTLTTAIGDSLSGSYGTWSIQLWTGGTTGTTMLAQLTRGGVGAVDPVQGGWTDDTVIFDSTSNPSAVGKNLFIRLADVSGSYAGSAWFDNVQLTSSASSDLILTATSSQVQIANSSQEAIFTKNAAGAFLLNTYVNNGGVWQTMFNSQLPVIQGTDFNLYPTAYTIVNNSASDISVQFSGTQPTLKYTWTMLVEAKTGSPLLHFQVSISSSNAITLNGLEPQPGLAMNVSSVPVSLDQGPGNIYTGTASAYPGNGFPAAYLWSGGEEAAIYFNMSPVTWMSTGNLDRFNNVQTAAFSTSGKTELGLDVLSRSGNSIPAGTEVLYDFDLYAAANATQPTLTQALNTMVNVFAPLYQVASILPANQINPGQTNWTTFAAGLSSDLMMDGLVYGDISLVPQTGSLNFSSVNLPNGGTAPLSNYGWTMLPGYGTAIPQVWHPYVTSTDFSSVNPLAAPATGNYVGFIQEPGGGCETPVGSILANTTYTITVAIGNRFAEGEGDWSIQLWAGPGTSGTTFLNQTFSAQSGVNHPVAGGWANNTVTFSSASNPAVVGQNLFIRIDNYNGSHPGTIFFNNIRVAGSLGPLASGWQDTPLFPEDTVSVLRVSNDYVDGTGSADRTNPTGSWDFATVNNYLAPWIAYEQLNPNTSLLKFIDTKVQDLPLFYDPQSNLIRYGTDITGALGSYEMSWENFMFSQETDSVYNMLPANEFDPAIAGKFLMGLSGLIQLAHANNYIFPQWFLADSKAPATQQDQPQLGTVYEPWQAGTYAWLMVQGYDITGNTTYLTEAETALNDLLGGSMHYTVDNSVYNINYTDPTQFPITEIFGNAWGIAAAQELYNITGNATYQTYSTNFFDSLMRMNMWYESDLSVDPVDQALQNLGMFRDQGGSDEPSPWENIEALLPMTVALKDNSTPSDLMLRVFDDQRINDFYFYPAVYTSQDAAPASVMNSAASYIPIEDFHTYEQGNANGSLGSATYMSGMSFWNYLMYEAYATSSNQNVMVLNLDAVDGYQQAVNSANRDFIVYNPPGATATTTIQMQNLTPGQYILTIANPSGATTSEPYSSTALEAGISLSLAPDSYMRLTLVSAQAGTLDATLSQVQAAENAISYAYQLLQQAATSQGVTSQILQLKSEYNGALADFSADNYVTATSVAQMVIAQVGSLQPAAAVSTPLAATSVSTPSLISSGGSISAETSSLTKTTADNAQSKTKSAPKAVRSSQNVALISPAVSLGIPPNTFAFAAQQSSSNDAVFLGLSSASLGSTPSQHGQPMSAFSVGPVIDQGISDAMMGLGSLQDTSDSASAQRSGGGTPIDLGVRNDQSSSPQTGPSIYLDNKKKMGI